MRKRRKVEEQNMNEKIENAAQDLINAIERAKNESDCAELVGILQMSTVGGDISELSAGERAIMNAFLCLLDVVDEEYKKDAYTGPTAEEEDEFERLLRRWE